MDERDCVGLRRVDERREPDRLAGETLALAYQRLRQCCQSKPAMQDSVQTGSPAGVGDVTSRTEVMA